ncbi:Na(+)-translocating NADH-quinone reductase subunit A [Prevotella sp.]|uniref:Na(+)-translocating NADH-quinone reductase subunit A n=1 Tax=Prevotella sp. TaxID=59823 RepID=UPI0025E9D9F2|nr:Na(+)-translocating NADH-quinone reductase subunit A [Prevotella sp.]
MANVIKLRKGLDINLKGKAAKQKFSVKAAAQYALVPDDFVGMTPKVVVREGDKVKAGDALFVNKKQTDVKFASPVSGVVQAVVRGDRRKVLRVVVEADKDQQYVDFGLKQVASLDGDAVVKTLLEAGLFGYINQLPYAVSTTPDQKPRAVFVSALRDMPLAGDFEYELQGNEEDFQTGLTALSKVAPVYLGIGAKQTSKALTEAKDVEVNVFDGPCPAGNVGVQVNNIAPVNKGEVVWTVDPTAVIFFGRLFRTGKVDLRRLVAVAGSEITKPEYAEVLVGQPIADLLEGKLAAKDHLRIINGNPLTGRKATKDDFVGGHTSEITVIPEGDNVDEMLGWILPRTNDFSVSRSYFSWLFGKNKEYALDARVKGGERHMIMSGEYDKVLPMDIYAEYLIKAIIAGDIDRMEQLGIYEVAPEDFAVAEFVDSSKLELQHIVRQGLDMLRKENA